VSRFGMLSQKRDGVLIVDYRIDKTEKMTIVGLKRKYATGQKAKEHIYKFWLDFDAQQYKTTLTLLNNNYFAGILGVCMPQNNGEMHYLIGVTTDDENNNFDAIVLQAGRYLVFEAKGPVPESIHNAMQHINKTLLPSLDYKLREAPFFEYYRDGNTAEDSYITELWLPIE
ncbi:GyrI-like domain-containing protein, partial [Staphylococcus arlettae]